MSKMRYEYSQRLTNMVGSDLKIRINNNRSTMLHVRWHEDRTNVSLHRMFMRAPHTIQKALVSYILGEDEVIAPSVRAFIDKNVSTLDHSHLLNPKEMSSKGVIYNLQALYNKINRYYFAGELDLQITWFGTPDIRARSKCTLGLYYDQVKLVKIHRLLDSPEVPLYVIEYVIYHEMVHAVCPAYKDEKGRNRIHGKEFKEQERLFRKFEEARDWLKKHYTNFFVSQGMKSNGRTQQMGKYQTQKKQSGCGKRQSILACF